jgi:hypothetical protein
LKNYFKKKSFLPVVCMSCMALKFVDTVQKFAVKRRQLLYWTKVDIQGWDD